MASTPPPRDEVLAQLLVDAVVGRELLVGVSEFASRVPQEQPTRGGVVRGTQVQEHQQCADTDHNAVLPEQERLVRREERQLAGQPGSQEEESQSGKEGDVLDHDRGSSNAWSTRK